MNKTLSQIKEELYNKESENAEEVKIGYKDDIKLMINSLKSNKRRSYTTRKTKLKKLIRFTIILFMTWLVMNLIITVIRGIPTNRSEAYNQMMQEACKQYE